jgi:sulfur carrier protein
MKVPSLNVTVNGDEMTVAATTVRALIAELGLSGGPVAVEQNGAVVPRAEHDTAELHEGDTLEIVHFVGGG